MEVFFIRWIFIHIFYKIESITKLNTRALKKKKCEEKKNAKINFNLNKLNVV